MNQFFHWQHAPAGDFAVIGDPVSHSLSPAMHTAAYLALGIDRTYRAVHVRSGEVGQALERLRDLGYRGVNVTVPHKEEVLSWVTDADPFAVRVRAANTIDLPRRACLNTDAPGFLETLEPLDLAHKTALLLGAGGSARSIAEALVTKGWEVSVFNRTRSKGEALALEVGVRAVEEPNPLGMSLILNTTSASLQGEEIPIEWQLAPSDAVAYDLMYAESATPFLARAASHGLRTVDGLPLLVAQGALSLEWWLGVSAPREAMWRAVRPSTPQVLKNEGA